MWDGARGMHERSALVCVSAALVVLMAAVVLRRFSQHDHLSRVDDHVEQEQEQQPCDFGPQPLGEQEQQQQPCDFGPQPLGAKIAIDSSLVRIFGDEVQREFMEQAQRMPALSRRLLLEGDDPRHVHPEALLEELRLPAEVEASARQGLDQGSAVLLRSGVLPPAACARLRAAVDGERQQRSDTVDGAPDEQLNLSATRLEELIGDAAATAALWRLPAEFAAAQQQQRPRQQQEVEVQRGAATHSRPVTSSDGRVAPAPVAAPVDAQIFIRRYSAGSRPWNPFHTDSSALTINLALIDDGAYDGGELLACFNGAIRRIVRTQGDATLHASTLLHGVSRMSAGVRYSLIIFIGRAAAGPTLDGPAEVAALAALMSDGAFLRRCEGVCGPAALRAMHRRYSALTDACGGGDTASLGRTVERVVHEYGAPHLQPTQILVAARREQPGVCWSLRALLNYAAAGVEADGALK